MQLDDRHMRVAIRSFPRHSRCLGFGFACAALIATVALLPLSGSAAASPITHRASARSRRNARSKGGPLTKKQIIALIRKYAGKGAQGGEGAQGPPGKDGTNAIAGPPAGPAGGALSGSFPDPTLAAGSVGTANFAAGAVAPEAELFGGFLPAEFQQRVTGTCSGSSAIKAIEPAGAVSCQPTGTITGITTSGGLTGTGTSGSINIGVDVTKLQSRITGGGCASDQVLQSVAQDGTPSCVLDHAYYEGNYFANGYESPLVKTITVPAGTWLVLAKEQGYNGADVNIACSLIANGSYQDRAGSSTGTSNYAGDSLMALITTTGTTEIELECSGPSGTTLSYPKLAAIPLGSVN